MPDRVPEIGVPEVPWKILQEIGEAVVATTVDGEIVYWNLAAEQMFGWSSDEITGEQATDVLVPEDRQADARAIRQRVKGGDSWEGKFWLQDREGNQFPVDATQTGVHDDEGNPVALVAILRDLSMLEQARSAIEDRSEELQRRNRQLEDVASATAHEFGEAVRNVLSHAQLVRRGRQNGTDPDPALDTVIEGARQLDRLTDGLRDYMELAARQLEPQTVDLDPVLEAALVRVPDNVPGEVAIESGELGTAYADPEAAAWMLTELVDNAVRFTAADRDPPYRVRVDAERDGDLLVIGVHDRGKGVPERYRERVFQPFERLQHHTEVPGVGLGLAMVRWMATDSQGEAWVSTSPGEGASFSLALPATEAAYSGTELVDQIERRLADRPSP